MTDGTTNPGSDEAIAQGCKCPSRGRYVRGCRCLGCKEASRSYARAHASANRDQQRKRNLKSRVARKTAIAQIKIDSGCVDCGYNACHAALQFDHLNEKTFNIAGNHNLAWARIKAEIAKCEVVCAVCHMVRTWMRANNIFLGDANGSVTMSVLGGRSFRSVAFPLSRRTLRKAVGAE